MMTTNATPIRAALALPVLSTLNSQRSAVFAQGSLTPPGTPAATMKTLEQVEPRTPISSFPCIITNPGSYYLTGNLNVASGDAITIKTNQVTIDLNGFTVSSTANPAAGTAILLLSTNVNGNADITIRDGHIKGGVAYSPQTGLYSGTGFANGITYSGVIHNSVRITGVSVSGCLSYGIYLQIGFGSLVDSCNVEVAGSIGIRANTVIRSSALTCGSVGISAGTASDSYGQGTGSSSIGIAADRADNCLGTTVGSNGSGLTASQTINCYGYGDGTRTGLSANTAINCIGVTISGNGVDAFTAANCYGVTTSGVGVNATVANNCYGLSSGTGIGLRRSGGIAMGCYGNSALNIGLSAYIANSCIGAGPTPTNVTYKFNMP